MLSAATIEALTSVITVEFTLPDMSLFTPQANIRVYDRTCSAQPAVDLLLDYETIAKIHASRRIGWMGTITPYWKPGVFPGDTSARALRPKDWESPFGTDDMIYRHGDFHFAVNNVYRAYANKHS